MLYRLRDSGFAGYLVGGAVRDLLVGGHPKDFDIATDATPEQVKALFRNSRLIGRRFRLAHVVFGREIIEVATFRANIDDGSGDREQHEGGRLLRDNVYGSIEDDAVRRDFTANALYYTVDDDPTSLLWCAGLIGIGVALYLVESLFGKSRSGAKRGETTTESKGSL